MAAQRCPHFNAVCDYLSTPAPDNFRVRKRSYRFATDNTKSTQSPRQASTLPVRPSSTLPQLPTQKSQQIPMIRKHMRLRTSSSRRRVRARHSSMHPRHKPSLRPARSRRYNLRRLNLNPPHRRSIIQLIARVARAVRLIAVPRPSLILRIARPLNRRPRNRINVVSPSYKRHRSLLRFRALLPRRIQFQHPVHLMPRPPSHRRNILPHSRIRTLR